jgi:vacuolar-type H+-ATPase subunit H
MSIYRVIDKLETYVREGTWLPLGLRVLSEERLCEFIEKMRSTLPEEVGRAKVIATNKDRVIRDAQEKAQQIVTEAAETHSQLIDQTEIVRRARATAEIVLREAEEKAQRIRAGADKYAAQVLAELEGRLAAALGSVKKGQEALSPRPAVTTSAGNAPLADAAAKNKRAAFDAQLDETHTLEPVEVT